MKKIKNSRIYVGIIISVLVIVIDLVLSSFISSKIYEINNNFVNFEEKYYELESDVNAYVTHHGIGNFVLLRLSSDDQGNIYCYYSSYIGTGYLLYMSEEDFYKIERENEIDNLKGTVRNIDNIIMDNILNYKGYSDYKIKSNEEFNKMINKSIYLDTVNVDYIDDTLFIFFAWLFLIGGIVGVVGSLILLIINNRIKIKEFIKKHTLSKIIFIISFIPYILMIITAVISMFTGVGFLFDVCYGIESFILTMLVLIWIYWPLLLLILIYQVTYIIIKIIKKKKKVK